MQRKEIHDLLEQIGDVIFESLPPELPANKTEPLQFFLIMQSQNIAHVTDRKEFTKHLINTHVFNVAQFQDIFEYIKFSEIKNQQIQNDAAVAEVDYFISLKIKGNAEPFHFLIIHDKDKEIKSLIDRLKKALPDECIELRDTKTKRKKSQPYPASFWAESGPWLQEQINLEFYDKIHDPLTLEAFRKFVLTQHDKNEEIVLLDIGGGYGRLAKKLVEEAHTAGVKLTYILIEPDKNQCVTAQRTLDEFNCKTIVVNSTLEDYLKSPTAYSGKINVVISSGGPINRKIVSYEAAKENLRSLNKILGPNGILISTGQTNLLLKKSELEKEGFTVLATAAKLNKVVVDKQTKKEEVEIAQRYVLRAK